jgi:hypothetical protein
MDVFQDYCERQAVPSEEFLDYSTAAYLPLSGGWTVQHSVQLILVR